MSFNRFERPLLEEITVEKTEMEDDIRIRCYEILTNDHRDLQPALGGLHQHPFLKKMYSHFYNTKILLELWTYRILYS